MVPIHFELVPAVDTHLLLPRVQIFGLMKEIVQFKTNAEFDHLAGRG